jgi:2-polyprenyl-3-methyl-5-hydroxy-6-metoxy-1,4-benzoquinol methylase
MLDLEERIDQPELMDTETFDAEVTRRTLGFLGLTARRFGGASLILRHLERWSKRWPRAAAISILDIGCGGGEIPLAIADWSRRRGLNVRIRAIDLVPGIAAVAEKTCARRPEIDVRAEDAFALADRGERFDYVISSLFLHHVHSRDLDRVLRLFDALAVRGVIASDLRRSAPSLAAVTALSLVAGNHVVRHDAPLSVRRAFRVDELRQRVAKLGLSYLEARGERFFRLSLAGEKI